MAVHNISLDVWTQAVNHHKVPYKQCVRFWWERGEHQSEGRCAAESVQSDDGSEELEEGGVAWKRVRGQKKFNLILRKKLKTQRLVTLKIILACSHTLMCHHLCNKSLLSCCKNHNICFCFHSLYFVALQLWILKHEKGSLCVCLCLSRKSCKPSYKLDKSLQKPSVHQGFALFGGSTKNADLKEESGKRI